ncbi:hypothetical protein BGZ65_002024 [Modicella reniformis]|uniref:Uncharacterized protein n=1 Tax=Modicella reniformis TaxID=1440133 RepID=A0A9P6J153_9FUNG|nr:hypothetical protein BGZ65_002024 [Modicella reniformis]
MALYYFATDKEAPETLNWIISRCPHFVKLFPICKDDADGPQDAPTPENQDPDETFVKEDEDTKEEEDDYEKEGSPCRRTDPTTAIVHYVGNFVSGAAGHIKREDEEME